MAVPSTIADLDATAANNSPSGSESIGTNLDDYLRAHAAIIKQVSNSSVTTSGTQTLSNKTLDSSCSLAGNAATATTATTATIATTATTATTANAGPGNTAFSFRNKIINGDMRIDQRNGGASVTPTATETYTVDRFSYIGTQASKFTVQHNAGAISPPSGFANYLGFTVASAVASPAAGDQFALYHKIEGLNCASFAFGSASASTVTLSFWVCASLTGVFSGGLVNSAGNRSYVFNYTINSANTWEQKTITIAGDTIGTWLTTNGIGIQLRLDLGSGSSLEGTASAWQAADKLRTSGSVRVVSTAGATFYITGVQLETGSVATPFEPRPYGTELALCQRYFEKSYSIDTAVPTATTVGATFVNLSGTTGRVTVQFCQEKRAAPTVTLYQKISTTSGSWDNGVTSRTASPIDAGTRQFSVSITGNDQEINGGHWVANIEL